MKLSSCTICLSPYSSAAPHRPKMLPCGHTTCETCIYQWANRNNPVLVQCPYCGKQFPELESVDTDIPVNLGMLEVLEKMEAMMREGGEAGEDGAGGGGLRRDNNTLRHLFSNKSSSPSLLVCAEHGGLPLTIHCWDCNKPVCDRCALVVHKNHSYTEIHQAAQKIKTDLEAHVKRVNDAVDEWKMINNRLIANMTWMKSEEEELLKMADRMCDEMHESLENERISLKKRIVEAVREQCNDAIQIVDEVEKKIKEGEKVIEKTDRILSMKKGKKEKKHKKDNMEDQMVSLVLEGSEIFREKQLDGLQRENTNLISRMKGIVAKMKERQLRQELKIHGERMTEAKLMMVEALKGRLTGFWRDYLDREAELAEERKVRSTIREKEKIADLEASQEMSIHLPCFPVICGIAWSKDGKSLYVSADGKVRQISASSGTTIRDLGEDKIPSPGFIALSESGAEIFVCDATAHNVVVLSEVTGKIIRTIGSTTEGSAADGEFNKPCCVATADAWHEILVCDHLNHRIQVFSMADGHFIRKFGSQGEQKGQLQLPSGITIDTSSSLIFVSESQNHRVQVFDREGKSLRQIGSTDGWLDSPHGIVFNAAKKWLTVCHEKGLSRFTYNGVHLGLEYTRFVLPSPRFISQSKSGRLAVSSLKMPGIFILGKRRQKN